MANYAFVLLIGAILVQSSHQILHGRDAEAGEMPFHAAVYHKEKSGPIYVCGGTVISARFILVARHCIMNGNGRIKRSTKIIVKLGILNLDNPDRSRLQTLNIEQIHALNTTMNDRNDIALLELSSAVQFNQYVQPAFLDETDILTGQMGSIAGWGVTETNELSSMLKIVQLPVIGVRACILSDRETFATTLDSSIFCAGHLNGTGICNGDSSGGLMFRRGNKWFVRGIASFTPARDDYSNLCTKTGYSGYTKVSQFLPWIRQITNLDAVSITESECGVPKNRIKDFIVNGEDANSKDWPWHAAIYHRKDLISSPQYACGGSLIHIQYVITADHCTVDPKRQTKLSSKALIVKFGIDEIHGWTKGTQQFTVFKIHRIRDRSYHGLRNDIALLEFLSEVEITDFVRPVCLPSRDITPEEQGTVVGFGLTEASELSPNLKMASMPVIRDLQCTKSDAAWGLALDIGLFCAGVANKTTVCNGDSGGGLVFQRNDIWEIGGLVSAGLSNGTVCRRDTFGAFTRVHHYLQWINGILGN